jgi:hypothetical protein
MLTDYSVENVMISPQGKIVVILRVAFLNEQGQRSSYLSFIHADAHTEQLAEAIERYKYVLCKGLWSEIDDRDGLTGIKIWFEDENDSFVLKNGTTGRQTRYKIKEIREEKNAYILTFQNGESITITCVSLLGKTRPGFPEIRLDGFINARFRFAGM